DDWDVIHGAATVGVEIGEDCASAGAVVVPVGGGGQLAGVALACSIGGGAVEVYGVEPELADDAARSLKSGTLERLAADPATLADGVKVKAIGRRNFEVIVTRHLVKDIVTVTEPELRDALRIAWQSLRLTLEPTAALPLAAYLYGKVPRGD